MTRPPPAPSRSWISAAWTRMKTKKNAGVGEDKSLAALDLLTRVIAANPATFDGFDRLAIDEPGAGRGFVPFDFAQFHDKHHVDHIEQIGTASGIEITPHCRNRRKAFGQQPPCTPTCSDVVHSVYSFAHVCRATPSASLRRRDKRRRKHPFPIGHIAWIPQAVPAMLTPGNISLPWFTPSLRKDGLNHNIMVLLNNFRIGLLIDR